MTISLRQDENLGTSPELSLPPHRPWPTTFPSSGTENSRNQVEELLPRRIFCITDNRLSPLGAHLMTDFGNTVRSETGDPPLENFASVESSFVPLLCRRYRRPLPSCVAVEQRRKKNPSSRRRLMCSRENTQRLSMIFDLPSFSRSRVPSLPGLEHPNVCRERGA